VIYALNGERVGSLADLRSLVSRVPPAGPVVLHVGRAGQLRYLTLTLD
jgi:S1-C subfamily serine protease